MFFGIANPQQQRSELQQALSQAIAQLPPAPQTAKSLTWGNNALAFYWIADGVTSCNESHPPFWSADGRITALFEGSIYNLPELKRDFGSTVRWQTDSASEVLAHLYDRDPDNFLERVNGKFAFILWDEPNQKLILGRDRFGIRSLFYRYHQDCLVFGTSLRSLLATGWIPKQIDAQVVLEYLLYCYNPSHRTIVETVSKVPASHFLSFEGSELQLHRYWNLNFAERDRKTEAQYCEEIPALIEDAVKIRLDPHRSLGVFLSGGIDSSAILGFAAKFSAEPLSTFSFRCAGPSYDESSYARYVARHFGTQHTEIQYQPEDVSAIASIVGAMDEPFCDIGIEIGTFLLGRAAQGQVDYIFSGEGGDELFGGHPVYTADKVAAPIDRIPRSILNPIAQLLQKLPDSDRKKNLQVKLKRFAYSLAFPSQLLSHRWRTYYQPHELIELCTADFLSACDLTQLFDSMLQYANAADGPDRLSRSLYSDYWTLVAFYLRRLELLRSFGLDNRLPLLDHRLVEYAAKTPSNLKIRGFWDTKYIYKQALVGIVPDKILFDRPKLGHSVPMKNWMRDNANVRDWMANILSSSSFKERGFFRFSFVERSIDEHQKKICNHSHRLWSLVILELWLKSVIDD
ncbi:asparagine synthase (glutamine-hydrolyzing) [Altericista sp. CCNU0014]|uniref:asparagine synthase (glutamine-hydrolyzing) n=1 Tax=Altericista sp. CCNU0014 TaxID=3082949 RepID=UPI0038507068